MTPRVSPWGWWGRCLAVLAVLPLLDAGAVAATAGPSSEAELVDTVRTALVQRDQETFDALINWNGAGTIKQRVVRFQVQHGFGRPIRSIALEPLSKDALVKLEARGTLKANMPVSHRLRVEFDEPPRLDGNPPVDVFLIGKDGGVFKIALVVRIETAEDDDD